MADVVVTVPKRLWKDWIDEGDLPGGEPSGNFWSFSTHGAFPRSVVLTGDREPVGEVLPLVHLDFADALWLYVSQGQRCYVVAHGRLRGYSPLYAIETDDTGRHLRAFIRRADAVAVTIPAPIRGFQGWRYRWWDRAAEIPFPDWKTAGVPRG